MKTLSVYFESENFPSFESDAHYRGAGYARAVGEVEIDEDGVHFHSLTRVFDGNRDEADVENLTDETRKEIEGKLERKRLSRWEDEFAEVDVRDYPTIDFPEEDIGRFDDVGISIKTRSRTVKVGGRNPDDPVEKISVDEPSKARFWPSGRPVPEEDLERMHEEIYDTINHELLL